MKNKLENIKSIIEKMIKEIDADARYHYKTATVFCNAPLALHQTAQESKMRILEILLKEINK